MPKRTSFHTPAMLEIIKEKDWFCPLCGEEAAAYIAAKRFLRCDSCHWMIEVRLTARTEGLTVERMKQLLGTYDYVGEVAPEKEKAPEGA